MKKLLKLFSFGFSVLAFNCIASAGCITRHIGNNTICVDIEKGSNNRYNVESRINCNDYDCAVNCSMILPDGTLQTLGTCNGRFTYNGNSEKKVKMYITINNDFDTIEAYYDFGDGERGNEVDYDDDWDDDDDDRDDDENDYIDLDTNDDTPSIGEYVNISIETDEDYVGKIYFSAKYRSSTSSSRSNISSTSSTYFTSRSTTWDNGYTSMSRSNYGSKNISNIFKFAKRGYYRIYAEDEDGNTTYLDFNVGGSSSSSHDLEVSADDTSISTSEYAKLYIQTDEDYIGKINFALKYRSSTSSSRSNISSLTNSTYVSNYSSTWSQGYYKMLSSDAGEKTLSNLVKFRKTGYYRITLTDIDGNSDYVDIHVSSNSSSSEGLEITSDDVTPDTSDYIDIVILTDEDYVGTVEFSAKYKSSYTDTWTSISRTSSTYFKNRSTTWDNGYINMRSSDHGEKSISNIFKFAKKGYFRIYAEDEYGNSSYLDFNVGTLSPLEGFTQKEFETVSRIYNIWPVLISKLKSENPSLARNTSWINLSNELYDNMGDVVNMRSNREFMDYDDFDDAFQYRYRRTLNLID